MFTVFNKLLLVVHIEPAYLKMKTYLLPFFIFGKKTAMGVML